MNKYSLFIVIGEHKPILIALSAINLIIKLRDGRALIRLEDGSEYTTQLPLKTVSVDEVNEVLL